MKPLQNIAVLFALTAAALFPAGRAGALDPSHYTVTLEGRCRPGADGAPLALRVYSSDPNFTLPDTPFQKVTKAPREKTGAAVIVRAGSPGSAAPPGKGLTENTRFLDLDDPSIRETARRLSREKEPVEAVERFVHNHISEKTFGIPLIPAPAVYRGRAGDCTEHTVLGVALLRSMGIPARAVVGMIYSEEFEGMRDVYVFHMWAEAFHRGRWVLVDATRPGAKQPSRYIAFTFHSLRSEAPLSYLGALSALKNLAVSCP